MAQRNCGRRFTAIVVGDTSDRFVQEVIDCCTDDGLECIRCEDVYAAVVHLCAGGTGVVVGRLEQLLPHRWRLLEIAGRRGFTCCFYAEKDPIGKRSEILAAMAAGARLVTGAEEVRAVFEALAAGRGPLPPAADHPERRTGIEAVVETMLGAGGGSDGRSAPGFFKEEFRTTKAELDALLGG